MIKAVVNTIRSARHPALADAFFRLARIFLLTMLVVLPLEAITAIREITMVGAALFLGLHFWARGSFRFRATALFWPLVFYTAVCAFSLLTAVDAAYSFKELRAEVFKGLLIFYTAVHFVEDDKHLAQAWGCILLGLGVMAAAGLIMFFQDGGTLLNHAVRAGSLHSGYGTLGTYLVLVWPFLLFAPRVLTKKWFKPLWGLMIAATAFLAFTTFSRAAWLSMTLQVALCVLALSRRRLRAALVLACACLAVLAMMFFAPGSRHGEQWSKLFKDPLHTGGTAGDLFSAWKYSAGRIMQDPFRGIGLGRHSFSKAFPEFRRTHQPLLWHAHNMFVDLTLQLGLQGLAAIILLLVVLLVSLWPRAPPRPGDWTAAFAAAASVMVAGFCVRNMFDDFFVDDTGMMFWMLCGLALGGKALAAKRQVV